ncbi:DUF6325 family protein [Streptomyces sp. NPDC021020]|uniref:DUF6325 family protein n=1 Tax=Streptomyces sp. NPDC021020 TaxID=3365109 RepID=UPI0037B188BE
MPDTLAADTVGPVDVAVIAFPGNQFNGDIAPALRDLQDKGTVRVLDLTFVRKDPGGTATVVELADSGLADAFEKVTGQDFDLLSEEDLAVVAEGMPPSSSALVVVWENVWAARLAAAVRGSKGQVASLQRVPHETVAAAVEALDQENAA